MTRARQSDCNISQKSSYSLLNKARTGPRSVARFCKILKLCNKFISIHYLRKYKYIGYPSVGDKINP